LWIQKWLIMAKCGCKGRAFTLDGTLQGWHFSGNCCCCTTLKRTHPFNGPLSRTTRVSWYQKSKTNLDFTEAKDSEWQWHQLVHMQVCTSLQTDNHASTPPLNFLQAGCPSCHPTNSVKALKHSTTTLKHNYYHHHHHLHSMQK